MIDDRVKRYRGLAGLAVANDQFALATANRDHRINRNDAGLNRSIHILAGDHARSNALNRTKAGILDRSLAVNRLAQRIHHAANQPIADRHGGNAPG